VAKYRYIATDSESGTVKGLVKAASPAEARKGLTDQKLQSIQLTEIQQFWTLKLTRRVPEDELMHFSRQLGAFIRAGVPILDSIEVIAEGVGHKEFSRVLSEVAEGLRKGETLSQACATHPKVFPHFFVSMLRSAELTGNLEVVLNQIGDYIERDLEAKRTIRGGLAYPALILVLALVAIVVITAFVLPRFEVFFRSLDARLPLPTRMVIAVASFLSNWWWALLAGLLAAILIVWLGGKTARGRHMRHAAILRMPVVGEIVRYAIVERVARVLGALVRAGVPLPESMEAVADLSNNAQFEQGLNEVREAMMKGEGIAMPLQRTKLFPVAVVQMVKVGENTGTLDEQLDNTARYFEQELRYKIKRLTTLFEPAVIIFVGSLVGFVAIALVSAMYGIFRQVGSI
jgi:type IV pilus assembly protein PilC